MLFLWLGWKYFLCPSNEFLLWDFEKAGLIIVTIKYLNHLSPTLFLLRFRRQIHILQLCEYWVYLYLNFLSNDHIIFQIYNFIFLQFTVFALTYDIDTDWIFIIILIWSWWRQFNFNLCFLDVFNWFLYQRYWLLNFYFNGWFGLHQSF